MTTALRALAARLPAPAEKKHDARAPRELELPSVQPMRQDPDIALAAIPTLA